jgi:gluconate 2-dehydrogenase gamma chain
MNRRDSLKALGLIAAGSAAVLSTNSCDNNTGKTAATLDTSDQLPGVQDFEQTAGRNLL